MKVKVAVLQYDVPDDTNAAVKKLAEMVLQASWAGAKLIVAPETAVGTSKEVEEGKDFLPNFINIAKDNSVYLATSCFAKEDKIYDVGCIITPSGEVAVTHKKIYLAKPDIEEDGLAAGDRLEIGKTEIGNLGVIVCKDGYNKYSHFLYEKLGQLAADIICVPSWSLGWKEMNTQEYIKSLFVYGAFASRAFILMSGNLNVKTNSFGRSLIVSPTKGVLKEGSVNRKEILYEELDLDEVKRAREFDSWWQPNKKAEIG